MNDTKSVTRKASLPIKVYCLPEEREAISRNAKAAGMSLSSFLLTVGQGYRVTGVTDYERVRELARINGDLGRLGGLLKLWLTDDEKTAGFGRDTILRLLDRIEMTQEEMSTVMKRIVRPKAGKKV
ncbi:conjugal transfer transcriptional regulator TraJ [Lautropia mirabilis]